MLALIFAGSCFAEDAVRPKRKAEAQWDGESFRDVTYKQVGKRKLAMDIYMPLKETSENSPVIYYVHGGGWAAGSKAGFGKAFILACLSPIGRRRFRLRFGRLQTLQERPKCVHA